MTSKRFDEIVKDMQEWQNTSLVSKASEYATKDRLYNFKQIAHSTGMTSMQACIVLMQKHLVALTEKIMSDAPITQEFLDEKIGDPYNYLVLLKALYEDEQKENGNV